MISGVRDALTTQITVIQKVIAISELFVTQKNNYKKEYTIYKLNKSYINQINNGIITVKLTIIKFAKDFIPISYYSKSAKKIFVFLIKYFKLPN